ncbi:transcription antitermination factor NusB [Actinomarinicola tropica]|uniref:Transcription antitermination protein NusB n=1 Tax=Actinomarinicola tropica TaxID=2789776 RepID=A0A5Q2RI05_9ACTN|nr:transcription antitermination factor NusB [Actinomarinicola tropica]QGG95174.1 transcription antitermination factor NusB [Actinomarinicola tropica]
MSSSRRDARERALGLLYEAETRGVAPDEVLAGLPLPPDPYAVTLVEGVAQHIERIDELISTYSRDWKLERMPAIDRAVVRLAAYELMDRADVPTGVAISEAVALASAYSTDESGRFVNGLVSRLAREVRTDAGTSDPGDNVQA